MSRIVRPGPPLRDVSLMNRTRRSLVRSATASHTDARRLESTIFKRIHSWLLATKVARSETRGPVGARLLRTQTTGAGLGQAHRQGVDEMLLASQPIARSRECLHPRVRPRAFAWLRPITASPSPFSRVRSMTALQAAGRAAVEKAHRWSSAALRGAGLYTERTRPISCARLSGGSGQGSGPNRIREGASSAN